MSEGSSPTRSSGSNTVWIVVAIVGGVLVLSCVGIAALGALLFPAVSKVRDAAARAGNSTQLRRIATAFHTDAGVNNTLPAHAIYSKDGTTPLLSWRVALLPYLERQDLYMRFKLDEPWDSEHNKQLIPLMPDFYALPGDSNKGDGLTYYQVFTGPGTVFDGPSKTRFDQITKGDGTTNTLLVVHAAEPVIWTKPADLVLPPPNEKMPALGGITKERTQVAWCDGSVSSIPRDLDAATLRAIVTPNGKEQVDRAKIDK